MWPSCIFYRCSTCRTQTSVSPGRPTVYPRTTCVWRTRSCWSDSTATRSSSTRPVRRPTSSWTSIRTARSPRLGETQQLSALLVEQDLVVCCVHLHPLEQSFKRMRDVSTCFYRSWSRIGGGMWLDPDTSGSSHSRPPIVIKTCRSRSKRPTFVSNSDPK